MILSILKIIGMIFLIILAIIIFIVVIVLVMPIRYRFLGQIEEEADGDISIKWAPVLLKVTLSYHNKQLEYTIQLFGGVVMTNTSARLSWLGRKFFKSEEEPETQEVDIHDSSADKTAAESKDYEKSEDVLLHPENLDVDKVQKDDWSSQMQEDTDSFDREEKASQKKTRQKTSFIGEIQKKIHNFQKKWKEFLCSMKKIGKKKDALLKVYHSERFSRAKNDLKQYAGRILRILKPDRLEGYIRFGLEDPANTGYVLGVLACMLPFYQGFLTVEPDFTRQIVSGHLKGNGKIRLVSVVKLAIQVILNKNLIKVTKKVQTILQA